MERRDIAQNAALLFGKAVYLAIAGLLLCLAVALIGFSAWDAWHHIGEGRAAPFVLLDVVGMTVLGLAIIDVSKYLIEEEVFRDRELRAAAEARGALTKFLTIIAIVLSLEAIILIFESVKSDRNDQLLYPLLLLGAVVTTVVVLGIYQLLSAKAQQLSGSREAIRADVAERPEEPHPEAGPRFDAPAR